jgi:hydrogenase maturation protease
VIGLGNPPVGDDAFGSRVLKPLRSQAAWALRHAELVDAHADLLGLIDRFPDYERVILVAAFLDPAAELGNPGRVALADEEALAAWPETSPSAHQLSPSWPSGSSAASIRRQQPEFAWWRAWRRSTRVAFGRKRGGFALSAAAVRERLGSQSDRQAEGTGEKSDSGR